MKSTQKPNKLGQPKTGSMKVMDGVKQKPEKRDMIKPTMYPNDKVDKKVVKGASKKGCK